MPSYLEQLKQDRDYRARRIAEMEQGHIDGVPVTKTADDIKIARAALAHLNAYIAAVEA
jgi:ubiquinone biosynthesis protein UbiJ